MTWLWPLRGCLDLLARPRLWRVVLTASLPANIIILVVAIGGLLWYWPFPEEGIQWEALGRWALTVAGAFVLVVPLLRGKAGRAVIGPYLAEHGRTVTTTGRGFGAKLAYLFKTLPLRILWVLATIGGTVLHPVLGVVVGALGVGHLSAADALDQALLACDSEAAERARLRGPTFGALLLAGGVAGTLFLFATLSILGTLFWVPALFLGAARRADALAPTATDAGGSPPAEALAAGAPEPAVEDAVGDASARPTD